METENKEQNRERIFLIGGLGDIGLAFARELSNYGSVIGLSRTPKEIALTRYISTDLLDKDQVKKVFEEIPSVDELIYLHLVGKFTFEDNNHPINDKDKDGIDDNVYKTNVQTFRNIHPYLTKYLVENPSSKVKVVGIGSSSDIYKIPYWYSYTQSKNELRKEFRMFYGNPKTFGRASALLINVSTVSGTQLSTERPFISEEFCLTPEEVVDNSLNYVLENKVSCLEMTLIKPNPKFIEPNYLYPPQIKKRWYKDMYGEEC